MALSPGVFARRALELTRERLLRLGPSCSPEGIAETLEGTAQADLYLSIACDEGIGEAWEIFTACFLPRVRAYARWRGASAAEAEDLAQDLPGHLAAPPRGGGARTRLGTYNGTVSLFDWLAVIVSQRLADLRRKQDRAPREAAGGKLEKPGVGGDPAALLLVAETAGRLEKALGEAWSRLAPKQAAALLLKFKDGFLQKDIAELFDVGDPQVSRVLKAALDKIRAEVEYRFTESSFCRCRGGEDGLWRALIDAVARHMARN